jgi:tRNA(fMet)-specific endonuclease VapC
MGFLIDASVFIDAERGRLDVGAHVRERDREEFFISVITASELLRGVWRAHAPHVKSRRLAFIEGILEWFPILQIDLAIARVHAQLWADLESRGVAVGPHDGWLAATCIARGHTLITGNLREFRQVPGLSLEHWPLP